MAATPGRPVAQDTDARADGAGIAALRLHREFLYLRPQRQGLHLAEHVAQGRIRTLQAQLDQDRLVTVARRAGIKSGAVQLHAVAPSEFQKQIDDLRLPGGALQFLLELGNERAGFTHGLQQHPALLFGHHLPARLVDGRFQP